MKPANIVRRDAGFVLPEGWPNNEPSQVDEAVPSPPSRGLGDWVEQWAKPVGCWLDRSTAKLPTWLVAERPFKGMRLAKPETRLHRRLRLATARIPGLPLSYGLRTQFCGPTPTCGCAARKAALNKLVADTASASAWRGACKTLATALLPRFKKPRKTP